jgi:ABC-2 type transport system ATP-binding protein
MSWGVTNLTVEFGTKRALDRVTLGVPAGRVTAVVGGDGAGKSTLLRVQAGVPVAATGMIRRPERHRLAYMPAASGALGDLTVRENLEFVAQAYRIDDFPDRAAPLLERAALTDFAGRLARDLSGGMRQKLGVIMAMLPDPDLLVLDEPTTGVDPVSRSELWRLIGGAAAEGTAVLVALAYLDEAERANWVAVLHEGRLLLSGTPAEVIASVPGAVVDTDRPIDRNRAWRRGDRWREWRPDAHPDRSAPPDLEDAAIVAALADSPGGDG